MPIWLELIVVLLAAYTLGFLLGWLVWGRTPVAAITELQGDSE